MKHIYIFDKNSIASIYGIGTYQKQLIWALAGLPNYSINYVNLRSDEMEFSVENKNECRYFTIPNDYVVSKKNEERYYVRVFFLLLPYLTIDDRDVSIFHFNYKDFLHIIPLIKQYIPRSKVVVTIHSQTWVFACNGNLNCFRNIKEKDAFLLSENEQSIKKSFEDEKRLYQAVDKIISLSNFTKLLLISDYQIDPSVVIHLRNGLKDEYIELCEEKKKRIRKELGIPETEKVILFVGRIDTLKGINFLIESFKQVLEQQPESHLFLVGDGNLSDYLRHILGYWNKITFTGYLDKKYLFQFYQIADLGILPSFHEQCSYVAIEMLMFNLPLLITNASGVDEMLEEVDKIEIKEEERSISISVERMTDLIVSLLQAPKTNLYRETYLRKYEGSIFARYMKFLYDSLS